MKKVCLPKKLVLCNKIWNIMERKRIIMLPWIFRFSRETEIWKLKNLLVVICIRIIKSRNFVVPSVNSSFEINSIIIERRLFMYILSNCESRNSTFYVMTKLTLICPSLCWKWKILFVFSRNKRGEKKILPPSPEVQKQRNRI